MNVVKTLSSAITLLVICCSSGCHGVPKSPYVGPTDDVPGKPDRFEPRQMSRSVTESIERLLTDPMFPTNYVIVLKKAREAGRPLPVLAVKPVLNNTGNGIGDSSTHQIFEALKTGLRKTGKFEVVDYTQRQALIRTVIDGTNTGDDSGALDNIGKYRSANLILTGDIRRDETDDRGRKVYFHYLNLEMQSTATGTVFWSDTIEVAKQQPRHGMFRRGR